MDPRDPPDVIEDHVIGGAFGDHAACLEHSAGSGRADEIGQLALRDEDHRLVPVVRHCPDSISVDRAVVVSLVWARRTPGPSDLRTHGLSDRQYSLNMR